MRRNPLLTKDDEGLGYLSRDAQLHVDIKEVTDDGQFEGYASVWNIVDQGGDAAQPGAFTAGLVRAKQEGRLIPMLWQHDRRMPIGTWLDISEDTRGLYVKGQLLIGDGTPQNPGVQQAREALALLRAKAIGGMSYGYRIPLGGAEEDPKRRGVFLLKEITLIEISLVTMPMLIQAKITAVKQIVGHGRIPTAAQFEEALREMSFPADLAKSIADSARPLLERAAPVTAGNSDFFNALGALLSAKG